MVQKKRPILFFIPKLCFTIFSPIFFRLCRQQAWEILLTLDDLLRSSRQKIIEAYFATKSVLLTQRQCRRDFGRDNVLGRRTIQRLVVKFWETGSVADAQQSPQWSTSFKLFKSNKSGSFSILWLTSSQNGFLFCFILFSLPMQDLNFARKELKVVMEDPQKWCSQNASFFFERHFWGNPLGIPVNSEYS